MNNKYFAGIDLGGTNIRYSIICTENYKTIVLHSEIIPHSILEPEDAFKTAANQIDFFNSKFNIEISAIGFAIAALLNKERTHSLNSPNLFWHNKDINEIAVKTLAYPFFIDNDANAAIYGESILGNGVGYSDILALTWGTGIGSGLILNGTLIRGSSGIAAEIGHTIINPNGPLCGCGRHGCLESFIGGKYLNSTRNLDNPQILFHEWRNLINPGCKIINDALELLGIVIANACSLVNPALILMGGGIIGQNPDLVVSLKEVMMKFQIPQTQLPAIKVFKLGEYAGSIGAALLARDYV